MGRLSTRAFGAGDVEAAGALLAARQREHRRAEPLLPARYEEPAAAAEAVAELWRTEDASGAVAERDGRVVAYVLGIRKGEVWGPNVWIESAGCAAEEPEELRDAYAEAAARWVDEGRVRQYALVPATDGPLVDAWFRLSFGLQHAHGIREVPGDAAWPEGVRPAEPSDLDALVALSPVISDHQDLAPVFGSVVGGDEDEADLRRELLEDIANPELCDLVAERDGAVVAAFQTVPVELSGTHGALARPEGAALLAWAATLPAARGSGAGVALTQATLAWCRERGYETIVSDWRETNLLSSRFWPRRGFRRTFLRLYRHVP